MSSQSKMANKKKPSLASEIGSGIMQNAFYPLAFVKILVQIGHEPLPPFRGQTLFRREQLFYPNSFKYAQYIHSVEGLSGLYRGLGMKVVSQSLGNVVYNRMIKVLEDNDPSSSEITDNKTSKQKEEEEQAITIFIRHTSKEITARCWGVVVSQPFHVMALRCMAQFVGGETSYSSWNVFQNAVEIQRGEGVLGFFSGLVPRLLFEASTIALTNGIAFLIKHYVFEERDIEALIDLFASLLASSVTYPLSVVSSVSAISGANLVASRPPKMKAYATWIDVFWHLYELDDLKRGSSTFFRLYKPSMGLPPSMSGGFSLHDHKTAQKALRSEL